MALDEGGRFLIIEIKTSAADYRSDRKWREYLDYCDWFAFAVPADFPVGMLPPEVGLVVADAYDAVSHRPAMAAPAAQPGAPTPGPDPFRARQRRPRAPADRPGALSAF